jgi:hypothetical protein
MKRMIYRGQWKHGKKEEGLRLLAEPEITRRLMNSGELMTAAAFSWRDQVFLYYECIDREIAPEEMFEYIELHLVDWPGQAEMRKWVAMVDVFHFNEPASYEHWLRKGQVERRIGRVAHLKPEMIASYVYYHYQLQEEQAFLGDKYEIIAIHENLMFGYQEFPKVTEKPLAPKKLNTQGTPANWNDSRMDLHFQPWEDGHLFFKPIDPVFTLYIGEPQS